MSCPNAPLVMRSHPSASLGGIANIPGDKSISHRALILGAMAVGETRISGLLEGQDVLDTAQAMQAFGAVVENHKAGEWSVYGVGIGGFQEPTHVINCGNSGTGVRLIMGSMATTPISATFTGDSSLRKRPMERITTPLSLFGATTSGRGGGYLPITLQGAENPVPVCYTLPVVSAQVKSAILLAGLNAPGETTVIESTPTRDHSERMLRGFGAKLDISQANNGAYHITLAGRPELRPQVITVPRDPSSAAFPTCAAIIVEGSDITIPGVSQNPARNGLYLTLVEMGANIHFDNPREEGGEPVADLKVRFSPDICGIDVPPGRAASMIDEYPILAVVAACADGNTTMSGVKELRVKESDRIDAMAKGLRACGVKVEESEDTLIIYGLGPKGVLGGATVTTHLDHRIAMSFLVMGMATKKAITIDDASPVTTSFPGFTELMNGLGGNLELTETIAP